MSDAVVAVPAPKATPKKTVSRMTAGVLPKLPEAAPKKPAGRKTAPIIKSAHPSYQDMIKKAVGALKERNGSSRQAIQKYIQATFKTCYDKVSQAHLKLALKRGVDSGALKRVKGTGASGSFRLAPSVVEPKLKNKLSSHKKTVAKPKVAGEKKVKAAKPKSVKAKTAVKPKKTVAEKKPTAKPKVAKKPKKATAKPAIKKPATPKAKKPVAKKAAPKK